MKSLNRVFIMGRLGHEPELLQSKNGRPYSLLRIATDRMRLNGEEQWETFTDWHSVFVWGKQAEICSQHLDKGALVFVEGNISYWQVAEAKLYKTAIHAEEVHFLNLRRSSSDSEDMVENLDNPNAPRNHNAVAHPA